jgi:dTDP-glucose 4,6-dehydratase
MNLSFDGLYNPVQLAAVDWEHLAGQHILITGGTGFLGSSVLNAVLVANQIYDLNCRFTVLTRNIRRTLARHQNLRKCAVVQLVEGDVASFLVTEQRFDACIHAAADYGQEPLELPQTAMRRILNGTTHVLEICRRTKVKSLLYVSSGSVYGLSRPKFDSGFVEDEVSNSLGLLEAGDGYAAGKLGSEALCLSEQSVGELRVYIVRCFTLAGPEMPLNRHFAFGNFIRDALFCPGISVKGDGKAIRSYLFTQDCALWLWRILLHGRPYTVYNVGSDDPIAIYDLAIAIRNKLAPGKPVSRTLISPSVDQRPRYLPSIKKARSELGLKAWVDLDSIIERTAESAIRSSRGCQS